MSKRNELLIGAAAFAVALALLLPSFTARLVAAALLALCATALLVKAFSGSASEELQPQANAHQRDEEAPADTFALGKLFEATMNGMREGLLVVDKDMKVVASNTAHFRGREGIEVVATSTFLWTFENGQIARFRMFQERAEALEAVGLKE